MQERQVPSLGQEHPLKKEMANHLSIFAWRILWTEEPRQLQSMGMKKSQTRLSHETTTWFQYFKKAYNLFKNASYFDK